MSAQPWGSPASRVAPRGFPLAEPDTLREDALAKASFGGAVGTGVLVACGVAVLAVAAGGVGVGLAAAAAGVPVGVAVGLAAAADDCLVKPIAQEDLLARVRAHLRRVWQLEPDVLAYGGVGLDPARQIVRRAGARST
jgi:hypothetical protein